MRSQDLLFFVWYLAINTLATLFPTVPLIVLGPVLVILEALGSITINSLFGIPVIVSLFISFMVVVVRILYFRLLGGIVEFILRGT